jgi:hypothetical protein
MKTPIDFRSRPLKHCGSAKNLTVRSYPSEEAAQKVSERTHPANRHRITIYIGEVAASKSPVVINTLLGSCVSVCIYDPVLCAGGMNHILLPACRAGEESPRCGIHAIEEDSLPRRLAEARCSEEII